MFLKSEATKLPQSVKEIVSVSLNLSAYLKIEAMKTPEGKFTKSISEVSEVDYWLFFFLYISKHFNLREKKKIHSSIFL